MRYVIFRDDDTNAFTPVECLEMLYRPFLTRGLPVNLATIPAVSRGARMENGQPEGFLWNSASRDSPHDGPETGTTKGSTTVALQENQQLVSYLKANPGFRIIQHGCHHDYLEFDSARSADIARRLDQGTQHLLDAGFAAPETFVAPYDRLSRVALFQVAARFPILSTGWYELRRLPYSWWPGYVLKKALHRSHWRVGRTLLLSHPGCLLSYRRTYSTMMGAITHYLDTQQLTVLVTHWWEYFRDGQPDRDFIDFLHETAHYVATHPELKVIAFSDLLHNRVPLN